MSENAAVITHRDYAFSAPTRWIHGTGLGKYNHPMFRQRFELAAVPAHGAMLIMADNVAEVWINGRHAAMHVVRNYIFDTIYEVYDVTGWLRPGTNVIAVRNWDSDHPTRGGFALEIQADGVPVCVTDRRWVYRREEALTYGVNYHISNGDEESVDGAKLVVGFEAPDFDDSGWTPAEELGGELLHPPYDSFRQSRIRAQGCDEYRPAAIAAVLRSETPQGYDLQAGPVRGSVDVMMTRVTADRAAPLMLVTNEGVRRWAVDGVMQPLNQWTTLTAGEHFVTLICTGYPAFVLRTSAVLTFCAPVGEGDLAAYSLTAPPRKYPWNEFNGPTEADGQAEKLLTVPAFAEMPPEVQAAAVPGVFTRRDKALHHIRTRTRTVPANGFAAEGILRDARIVPDSRTVRVDHWEALMEENGEAVIGVQDGGVNLVLDFGEEKVGRLAFEVEAPAGTVLDAACFEMINDKGMCLMSAPMTLRYVCRDGAQSYISRRRRGFRYVSLNIAGHTGEVRLKNVRVLELRYPVESGAFRCADERLNQIYQMSARTAELCMLEAYVDCPGYEQNPWTGDARVTGDINLYNFGAYEFDRQYLRLIAQSIEEGVCRVYRTRNPKYQAGMYLTCAAHPTYPEGCIPVWSFMWLLQVWDHYECTGDRAALAEVFYAVEETLTRCEKMTDDRGLFDMPGAWNLIEWANNDLDFYGEVVANNIMLAHCFGKAADMAEVLDRPERTAHYRAQQAAYRAAVNRYGWSEEHRAYVDTVRDPYAYEKYRSFITEHHRKAMEMWELQRQRGRPAVKPAPLKLLTYEEYLSRGRISVQTNTLALLYDAVPAERQADAMRFLLDNVTTGQYVSGTPANRTTGVPSEEEAPGGYVHIGSPFFMYFALKTLYKYGYAWLALDAQRQAWGEFLDSGINTCLETFKKGPEWTRSIAHAWSGSPALFLIREVLGVRPVKPGFAEFTVTPRTDGLDWAEGSVPTPRGRIWVAWKKDAQGRVTVTCKAPDGCKQV